jgi:hypothetical protein
VVLRGDDLFDESTLRDDHEGIRDDHGQGQGDDHGSGQLPETAVR